MIKRLIMIGAGGHAKVVLEIIMQQGLELYGISAPRITDYFDRFSEVLRFSSDEEIFHFKASEVILINGIGHTPRSSSRADVYNKFRNRGYEFLTIKSNLSCISSSSKIGMGAQIMPGAIINSDANIGENTIVNTGSIVEHDCFIGSNNHIAPGCVLCGGVVTKKQVFVGAGSIVLPRVIIGENVLIAAGSTVPSSSSSSIRKNGLV